MTTPALERIEAYYDTVPRSEARVVELSGFTLFVGTGGRALYARPHRRPRRPSSSAGLELVRRRSTELGQPPALEWIAELHPGLAELAQAGGWSVQHCPLMRQRQPVAVPPVTGYRTRVVPAGDPDLPAVVDAIGRSFCGSPGPQASDPSGATPADGTVDGATREPDPTGLTALRAAIRAGLTVLVAADDGTAPAGGGTHSPRGRVTEITGVGVLPAHRGRGLGTGVTSLLAADARARGISTIFLSAGSVDAARIYARCGFSRIGTACIAAPEDGGTS